MFRSLMTIIRELYLYLAEVIFMLKHSVKLRRFTGCPRRNVPDFGGVFLMLKYTDITQNTYIQS